MRQINLVTQTWREETPESPQRKGLRPMITVYELGTYNSVCIELYILWRISGIET